MKRVSTRAFGVATITDTWTALFNWKAPEEACQKHCNMVEVDGCSVRICWFDRSVVPLCTSALKRRREQVSMRVSMDRWHKSMWGHPWLVCAELTHLNLNLIHLTAWPVDILKRLWWHQARLARWRKMMQKAWNRTVKEECPPRGALKRVQFGKWPGKKWTGINLLTTLK